MTFRCHREAVLMVQCTWSTGLRQHRPLWYDTVLLSMGTCPESRCKSSVGCIPPCSKGLFTVRDAESSVKRLGAFIQTFATGLMDQTAGIAIVQDTHHPLMQPSHDGLSHFKHRFGVSTSYIIPLSTIQGAVHLHRLTSQPCSVRWYLSNTIVLNTFNLLCR